VPAVHLVAEAQHNALEEAPWDPAGAGWDPEKVKPFERVLKDGFYEVDCVKDYMLEHGDKLGAGRHAYELGGVSNVSIAHYTAHVLRVHLRPMTHQVCFEFCRTVPEMAFFGLTRGKDCYCSPYYKAMPGDDSLCDAQCEGEPGTACGGVSKSSIFQMHECGDTLRFLDAAHRELERLRPKLAELATKLKNASAELGELATGYRKGLGKYGFPIQSEMMQDAKIYAGNIEGFANRSMRLAADMEALAGRRGEYPTDLPDTDVVAFEAAEAYLREMEETNAEAVRMMKSLAALEAEFLAYEDQPPEEETYGKTYYPIMYFIDSSDSREISACNGDAAQRPIYARSFDQCAQACDAKHANCHGFNYFPAPATEAHLGSMCFLFKRLEHVTYYSDCSQSFSAVSVQAARTPGGDMTFDLPPVSPQCVGKLEDFVGRNISPDPSGKCDLCLKTARKRCYYIK